MGEGREDKETIRTMKDGLGGAFVFTKELDLVALEVTNRVDPFHEMEARGSRITALLPRDSAANARLDSNTN